MFIQHLWIEGKATSGSIGDGEVAVFEFHFFIEEIDEPRHVFH